jgi:hypothetical protein
MPNPRMNAAKMKAEALKKAKANKMKSKMGSPTNKTGKTKPAAAVKNAKVYKKIKSTSTYKPKFEKETIDDKDLVLQEESPAKMSGRSYDMEKAYDKKLPMSERFHYLENERHDAPGKMKGSPYHMSNELKYGGPVIDQMKTLSQAGASKVLRHMKK